MLPLLCLVKKIMTMHYHDNGPPPVGVWSPNPLLDSETKHQQVFVGLRDPSPTIRGKKLPLPSSPLSKGGKGGWEGGWGVRFYPQL